MMLSGLPVVNLRPAEIPWSLNALPIFSAKHARIESILRGAASSSNVQCSQVMKA
jgi:hypothetical protein